MAKKPSELIEGWIFRQIPQEHAHWLHDQMDKLKSAPSMMLFDTTFGLIPRRLGKGDLELSSEDLAEAENARSGWLPAGWSVDVAARILLLLENSKKLNKPFSQLYSELQRTADLGEKLALYHGLPLFEKPETLSDATALGLRTNMKAEFQAIAHNNPFPAEQFSENIWNNMVLKALFIGILLEPIQGLDDRANPELARILRDYAHERWAADRIVSPELWRCIGPFAKDEYLDDFEQAVEGGNETTRKAIALALRKAPDTSEGRALALKLTDYNAMIDAGKITWVLIADEMFENALAITRKMNTEVEMTR